MINLLEQFSSLSQHLFRPWDKRALQKEDYGFAISSDRSRWDCLARRLSKSKRPAAWSLGSAYLEWELVREFFFEMQPFATIPEHQAIIEKAEHPTASKLPGSKPLSELTELTKDCILEKQRKRMQAIKRPAFGVTVHAFEIDHSEETRVTVQRFRAWLVAHKKEQARLLRCQNGPNNIEVILKAVAVRRLKLAGYSREEAERMLRLKPRLLTERLWLEWPQLAETEIRKFRQRLLN